MNIGSPRGPRARAPRSKRRVPLSEQGKYAEAEAAFAKVAADAPEGYRVLARMRAAGALAQVKPADAVKAYDELSADASLGADLAGSRRGARRHAAGRYRVACRHAQPARCRSPSRHAASVTPRANCWRCRPGAITILLPRRTYLDMIASDAEIAGRHARARGSAVGD